MPKQAVIVGSNANDGSGDAVRTAFTKLNQMMSEIYQNIGDGTNLKAVPFLNERNSFTAGINTAGIYTYDPGTQVSTLGNGIFSGSKDGSSSTAANLLIKSWYGVGFASTFSNPDNLNSIWFDLRKGSATFTGTVSQSSDVRLKENITEITSALDKVNALRGVTYKRKTATSKEQREVGLIAQDVQKVLPEAVFGSESEDDYLSLNYSGMVGLLVSAIKELSVNLDEAKTRILKLETKATV